MCYNICACVVMICSVLCAESASAQADVDALLDEVESTTSQLDVEQIVFQAGALLQLAEVHSKAGNREKATQAAQRVFELVSSDRFVSRSDQETRDLLFWGTAQLQAQNCEVPEAVRTVTVIGDVSRRHLALVEIVVALADAGDLGSAVTISRHIDSKAGYWKCQALRAIGAAQATAGDFGAAHDTVAAFDDLEWDPDDCIFVIAQKELLLDAISVAEASRGKVGSSLETMSAIGSSARRFFTLCDVARILAAKNHLSAAKRALMEALVIAEDADVIAEDAEPEGKVAYFEQIATVQSQLGDFVGAGRTISTHLEGSAAGRAKLQLSISLVGQGRARQSADAFEAGLSLIRSEGRHELWQRQRLHDLAIRYARIGKAQRAIEILDSIPDEAGKDHALRVVAVELSKRDVESAALIAHSIENAPFARAAAFRAIALAQAANERPQARSAFHKALEATQAIPIGGGTDVIAFYQLAQAQREARFVRMSRATFDLARDKARNYPDAEYTAQLLQDIARAQTASGDVEEALRSVRSEESLSFRIRGLLGVSEALAAQASP